MKRKNGAIPAEMMQRWKRAPVSCQLCRTKKLRCDRSEPCSNCSLRKVECKYAEGIGKRRKDGDTATSLPEAATKEADAPSLLSSLGSPEEILARIRLLEHAVFDKHGRTSPASSHPTPGSIHDTSSTHIASQVPTPSASGPFTLLGTLPPAIRLGTNEAPDLADLSRYLPPRTHAIALFGHFEQVIRLTFGVFHVPSTRNLLDHTYKKIFAGEDPDPAALFLLFCIFAGAALVSTPQLLQCLNASQEESSMAYESYTQLALSIIDNTASPLPPSSVALVGIISLMHLITHADGLTEKVHLLRTKAVLMARTMQVHRLDTPKSRECRRLNGSNPIEVEIQRRAWWQIISTDWLLSFCGGQQEGTYIFHPNQMKVNLPKNVDDDFIAAAGDHDLPVSVPTSMSAFIHRVRLSELCREVVDTIPSMVLDPQEIDYDTVLALDAKFQDFLNNLPVFFKLDPTSIQQSREICRERPYIPWQRISLHYGINTRICRLHRPFHFAGSTNPKYAFSRMSCIRAAQTVLELRRSMDEIGEYAGLRPSQFWTVMQHVFLAAITLATDVSLDPTSSCANIRKAEVLAACRMLENSQKRSGPAREAIHKGVHTLMAMIQKQCPVINTTRGVGFPIIPENSFVEPQQLPDLNEALGESSKQHKLHTSDAPTSAPIPLSETHHAEPTFNTVDAHNSGNIEERDWDQLWSEFFNAAGEWDTPQWANLMEGIDLNLGPTFS